jgi:hypothetical protein
VNAGTPLSTVFGVLPTSLRDELLAAFNQIVKNFRERRWEPAELNGGKLCEVVHSILQGYVDGKYPIKAKKPSNMVDACKKLETGTDPTKVPRSVRIQIPRMLVALYEIRNNRNVGHVGGDVDPTHMDAVCVLQMSKWVVAELVRILHAVDTETATQIVDALVDRETPLIWEVNGKKRVMRTDLSMRDKTLVLLHGDGGDVAETDLVSWVEHSNPSVYRRDILRKAHKARLLEYDQRLGVAQISPRGIEYVEETLLPSIA